MKILIAYDGSDCSEAALVELSQAGLPDKVEALVVSVAEKWLPAPPPSAYEILEETLPAEERKEPLFEGPELKKARELAALGRDRLRTLYPGWLVDSEAYVGSPASEILARAKTYNPDLIVVGSHGRSRLGRLFFGSVSEKIITHSHSSVRVARESRPESGQQARQAPPVVIVGYDGSRDSKAALQAVARSNWGHGTRAIVVSAHDPVIPTAVGELIPPVVAMAEEENRAELDWIRNMAASAAYTLTAAGLCASWIVKPGDPKKILIQEAAASKADCIFVGASGLGALGRLVLGSVSMAVSARADCSVEIVRPEIKK